MTRIAAIQMASGPKLGANLVEAERLIGQAAESGAKLIVLPENFAFMGEREQDKLKVREQHGGGPIQGFLATQAQRHGVWLVGGTVPLACDEPDKVRAACLVYDAEGREVARYDKVHLFDVTVTDNQAERYEESMTIEPGRDAVVLDTPVGRLGLAVCYDLRFPEQFRCMLSEGMEIIALPAAFTAITGKAHWEVLVRSRAIENLAYVIAADQGGYHLGGRETHGDSMIVDPWGIVLKRLPRGAGVISAELDRERLLSIRRSFPVTDHRKFNCVVTG
jgi:predicted amidohydrolase